MNCSETINREQSNMLYNHFTESFKCDNSIHIYGELYLSLFKKAYKEILG